MSTLDQVLQLQTRIQASIIGQEHVVERLLIGLLADGNLLLEGLPGLAKTRAVKSLARNLDATLSRIQFTPDLLPSDITGTEVYHSIDGRGEFRFDAGPIFANLVLADEINRAPAKVQAALLEAMEERQVTVAGKTHRMEELFMVLATQNPIEQEGTYPLPEAQMDRFLMHILIDYPDPAAEQEIVRLVRSERGKEPELLESEAPIALQAVFAAREEIHSVYASEALDRYIVELIDATRFPGKYDEKLKRLISVGASPRGSIALDRCARTYAWLHGRDHATADDVRAVVHDCLRHRVSLSYEATAEGFSANDVVGEIVQRVAAA